MTRNSDQDLDNVLEVWKTTVDVQKHFNELCLKARQLAITALSAFLGAVGYLWSDSGIEDINPYLYFGLSALATAVWVAFYFNDRHGYHRLLKGAVSHGIKIEEAYKDKLPINLSEAIKEESHVKILGITFDSNKKVTFFYGVGFFVIWAPMLVYLIYKIVRCFI